MTIKCDECSREFQGNKITKDKIFVCRFCMGEGIDKAPLNIAEEKLIRSLEKCLLWWQYHAKANKRSVTKQQIKDYNEALKLVTDHDGKSKTS